MAAFSHGDWCVLPEIRITGKEQVRSAEREEVSERWRRRTWRERKRGSGR